MPERKPMRKHHVPQRLTLFVSELIIPCRPRLPQLVCLPRPSINVSRSPARPNENWLTYRFQLVSATLRVGPGLR